MMDTVSHQLERFGLGHVDFPLDTVCVPADGVPATTTGLPECSTTYKPFQ